MSKYNSPFSIGQRKTVFIGSNDPRVKGINKLEQARSKIGHDIEIVNTLNPLILEDYVEQTLVPVDKQFFTNIIYANNKFLATSIMPINTYYDSKIKTFNAVSNDGVSWTLSTISNDYVMPRSIAADNSSFLIPSIVGDSLSYSYSLQQSTDGINWTTTSLADTLSDPPNFYNEIYLSYGNNKYIRSNLYSPGSGYVVDQFYSNDLNNWTSFNSYSPAAYTIFVTTFVNDKFFGTDGYKIYESIDGYTWSAGVTIPINKFPSASYGNSLHVWARTQGSYYGDNIFYSSDGLNWLSLNIPIQPRGITYGSGKFVVVGVSDLNEPKAMYSTDGISWNLISDTELNNAAQHMQFRDIKYGNGKFVIVGNIYLDYDISIGSNNVALYSSDGLVWNKVHMPDKAILSA